MGKQSSPRTATGDKGSKGKTVNQRPNKTSQKNKSGARRVSRPAKEKDKNFEKDFPVLQVDDRNVAKGNASKSYKDIVSVQDRSIVHSEMMTPLQGPRRTSLRQRQLNKLHDNPPTTTGLNQEIEKIPLPTTMDNYKDDRNNLAISESDDDSINRLISPPPSLSPPRKQARTSQDMQPGSSTKQKRTHPTHRLDFSTDISIDDKEDDNISDDATVRGGSRSSRPLIYTTRCTLKLQFAGGNNAENRCLNLIREFFSQMKRLDKWCCIAPWYEEPFPGISTIEKPADFNLDTNSIPSYFPRLLNRNVSDTTHITEYVNINFGHSEDLKELIKDMSSWFKNGSHAMYIDMLQAERRKEAGFFINSFSSMDLDILRDTIESTIQYKVGLKYKPITGASTKSQSKPIRAIHVDVDVLYFSKALRALSDTYGKSNSGFDDGRKMRFFASLYNAKSAETKGNIRRGIERQQFFENNVRRDYFSDILYLDVIPRGSTLPSMRKMIADIKSFKFPHLNLIHSVDETWIRAKHRGDYTYLVMPHLEEEAHIMMSNLVPYLKFVYGKDVLKYFTSVAKDAAADDVWDDENKRVICTVDENAAIEDEDDFIGFKEAKEFLEAKKSTEATIVSRPSLSAQLDSSIEQLQIEAQEKIQNLSSTVEAAYYKDSDSISTLDSLNTTPTTVLSPNYASSHKSTTTSPTANSSTLSSIQDISSISSSLTMESFQSLQRKVANQDDKLDHLTLVLEKMSEVVLQGNKTNQSTLPITNSNTGGDQGSSGARL